MYAMRHSNDHKVTFFASMIQIVARQMWSTCNFSAPEIFVSSTREIHVRYNLMI